MKDGPAPVEGIAFVDIPKQQPKKARYMSQWESSLYSTISATASLSLEQLFDARRWQERSQCRKKGCGTSSSSSVRQPVATFRLEHREGGALAQHLGEERILLFASDRKGAIAKIIFSSTPATEESNEEGMSEAKIHVLEVKDLYRGYDLGGLLFIEALMALERRYNSTVLSSGVRCLLDAEEDARRHSRLVGFYKKLGCVVKPNAKPQFLNNNDGETYRKVPMLIDLVPNKETRKRSLVESARGFVPIRLLGSQNSKSGKAVSIKQDSPNEPHRADWVMVADDASVQFRTTQGLYLTLDSQGRCLEDAAPAAGGDLHSKFQIFRVSDSDQHVLSGDDEGFMGGESDKSCEKELWVLVSHYGSFLRVDPDSLKLECSIAPAFWQVNSDDLSLTCTTDTPARRQHHRRAWMKQTVEYVQAAKDRYLGFQLSRHSLKEALDLVKMRPGFPFRVDTASRGLSLRNVCFRTAEAARAAGHPDWIQFVALIHALGGVVNCLDMKTAIESEDDYDWTITCSSRVVGCASPENATFAEFQALNSDKDKEQYKSPLGVYNLHSGLENVNLTWSGAEYLVQLFQHNNVDLPEEAFSVLRLFSLDDWHSKNLYETLTNEDDIEILPFVVDFDRLRRQTKATCLQNEELTTAECDHLWESHYAAIVGKFGADVVLNW